MMRKIKKAASLLMVISVLMSLLSVAASAVDTVTLIKKDDSGQDGVEVVYTAEGEWNCLVFKQATGAVVWTADAVEDEASLWAALQEKDPSLANSVDQYAFTTATYFSLGNFLSGNPYSHTGIVIDLTAGTVTVTGSLSHLDFFQIPGDTPPEEPGDPTPASATLGGTKIVSVSGEGAAPDEVFTFVLTDADGAQVDTATCTGAGDFTFDALTYTEAGTYTYTITEQAGSAANWTYDNASYTATVTVSDVEGALTADVVYAQSGESVAAAAFTNTYTVPQLPDEPFVQATLGGTKAVSVSGEGTAPSEVFTFVLTDADGAQVDTATCTGAGDFTFDALTYTEAGTYTYTITEQAGSAANWTYDNASYTATVTVSDVEGTLTADVAYARDGADADLAAFTNTYTVPTPPVDPPIIPPDTPNPTPEEPETPPEEIEEPDVPLGEAPKTGDWSSLWLALSGLSGLSLAGLGLTGKKRDEE